MKRAYLLLIVIVLLFGCNANNGKNGTATNNNAGVSSTNETSDFPNRPIKLYVGFQPGGGTDMTARAVATLASEYLGQPVIVVNMPGASSTLAANKVANSKPDGYTLLIAGGSETVSVGHFKRLPYHPIDDFSPIIRLTVEKIVLTLNAKSPYKTLDDFVAAAKEQPGHFKYSSSGQFGIYHSTGLAFCREAGISMKHVPYNGGAPSVAALMGNHIDMTITSPVSVASLFNSGQLNCLAQCSPDTRSTLLPNVPLMNELGYNINIQNQKGLVAPAGTPNERIKILHDCFKKVLENPEFMEMAIRMQLQVAYLGPEDFQASIQSIYDEIGVILRKK